MAPPSRCLAGGIGCRSVFFIHAGLCPPSKVRFKMNLFAKQWDANVIVALTDKSLATRPLGIGDASTFQLVGDSSNGYSGTVFIPPAVDVKKKLVHPQEAEARKSLIKAQMANLHRDTLVAELIQWKGDIGKTVHARLKAIVALDVNLDSINWKMGTTPVGRLSASAQEAKYNEQLEVAKVAKTNLELLIANRKNIGLVLSVVEKRVLYKLLGGLKQSIAENARPVSPQPKPVNAQPQPQPMPAQTAQTAQWPAGAQPPSYRVVEGPSTDALALRPARTDLDRALEEVEANEAEQRILSDAMNELKLAHKGLIKEVERLLALSASVNTTTTLNASATNNNV